MADRRLKVLFVAEAVTLAHVARPVALASRLDPQRYELVLACDPRYAQLVGAGPWQVDTLASIPVERFTKALARGAPVYDLPTLQRYVQDDLALIRRHQPDLVVGDFRLSLSVSARHPSLPRPLPYLTLCNAYWTPGYARAFPMPVLPMTRLMPLAMAGWFFDTLGPTIMASHCRPMDALRRQHGLPPLGPDLRRVYTDADHRLVPDIEPLYPLPRRDESTSFVGALAWSPAVPLPDWWHEPPPAGRPTLYLSMGSSGSTGLFNRILEALAMLPVQVLATSAGGPPPRGLPANVRLARYLPGDQACARADLVVCNGGSLTTQQAFTAGVPVLGIADNMDQFQNMIPIVEAGAGELLRADRLSAAALREACLRLARPGPARDAARRLQAAMARAPSAASVFDAAVQRLLAVPRHGPGGA